MGLKEDALRNNGSIPSAKRQEFVRGKSPPSTISRVHHKTKRKGTHNRNLKQIFILSFDALRERKVRSVLTILMVVTGGGLMVALNGMSAGVADFINKQLSILAPNVFLLVLDKLIFVGDLQHHLQ